MSILKHTIQNLEPFTLKLLIEKKIGFNKGPEYSEETVDLLKDFASSAEMLNKELDKKILDNDDPKVQEILNILDNNLSVDSEFLSDIQKVLDLIEELPNKPTEREKIGFKQSVEEIYMYNKTNKNG